MCQREDAGATAGDDAHAERPRHLQQILPKKRDPQPDRPISNLFSEPLALYICICIYICCIC